MEQQEKVIRFQEWIQNNTRYCYELIYLTKLLKLRGLC